MANVSIKISQLKQLTGSAITNDDYLPIVDSGSFKTYRVTLGDIISKAQGGIANLLNSTDQQIMFNHGGIVYGDNTLAYNYLSKSLANGYNVTASGLYSHAEGYYTIASGTYSHAEGYQTYAFGTASHAEGYQTYAFGTASSAKGIGTYAYGNYQTVVGKYNVTSSKNTSSLFIVGAGTSNSNTKDIFLVDTGSITVNGNINFSGNLISASNIYIPNTASYAGTSSYALNVANNSAWKYSGLNFYYSYPGANVGIQTSNPVNALDVVGNISASAITASLFFGTASYATSASYSTIQLPDITDNTSSHRVGIYQTNPQHTLDINGDLGLTGYINGNSLNSNFIGNNAGYGATSASYSNFIGNNAGYGATNAYYSNFFGNYAGNNATNANYSNFFGNSAGNGANYANSSNFFGQNAGYSATNANYSNFFGSAAGYNANYANSSNFLGLSAGFNAVSANNSNFFGNSAGRNATNANYSNFLGYNAGYGATNANLSNFLGYNAGQSAVSASNSNFFGISAGYGATHANNSIFIGYNAGSASIVNNSGGKSSILIGDYTNTSYSDSIAIGKGTANSKNNQFNIGNVLYGLNIYSGSSSTSTPQSNGKIGIGTNNPTMALTVSGSISSSGLIIPQSSSAISAIALFTGSIFYSGSKLWVYTGTSNNYGAGTGWSTSSLSI
jgi:hypothetical protein